MAGENKSTDSEKENRILTVMEMIVKGCARSYICRYMSEKHNVGDRQTDRYLAEATERIKAQALEIQDNLFEKLITRYEDLYRKNYTIEDFRECRNIMKDYRDLMGLDAAKKQEHAISVIQPLFPDVSANDSD